MQAGTVHVAIKLDRASQARVRERLEAAGLAPIFVEAAQLQSVLPEVDVLFIGRPPRLDWSLARCLRLIHVAGTGVDPLFPAHGLAADVMVSCARGAHALAVRDHALALLLALQRSLPRAFEQQQQKRWLPYATEAVADKRLVIVGLGSIGSALAASAAQLGFRVHGVKRRPCAVPAVERVVAPEEAELLLPAADAVVLCLPLTAQTRGFFDARLLALLPPHAVLVNVSRGAVLDEAALQARLRAGQLRGAALDVLSDEPLTGESRLWECPGLIITPHVAGYTPDYLEPVVDSLLEALRALNMGQLPKNHVDREAGY